MNRQRTPVLAISALALMLGVAQWAGASPIVIEYQAVNLAGNTWEYQYRVSDHTFMADGVLGPAPGDQGFVIYFDNLFYALLDPAPIPPNADWEVLTGQPNDVLDSDGYYDALAVQMNPSLADLFRISFVWEGPGTPGSQPFQLYQLDGALSPVVLESGETVPFAEPIPEPGTLLLMATGAGALWAARKRQRTVAPSTSLEAGRQPERGGDSTSHP